MYNALGQRVQDYQSDGSNGSRTLTYPRDIFGHRVGIWDQTPASNWTGSDMFQVQTAGLLFQMGGSSSYLLHSNPTDTTPMVTDQAGAVDMDNLFYPWGKVWQRTGSNIWASFGGLGFPISYEGSFSTLFRSYQPPLGRWLSPDKLGGDVTDPQSLNRYAYVKNNPATLTDPLGLSGEDPADPCSDPYYADTSAECEEPSINFGCAIYGICSIGAPGGGFIYNVDGNGGGAPAPPSAPPAGQPPLGAGGGGFPSGVGNAFLGFHLFCSQSKIGAPVNVTVPAACILYFLGLRFGAFPVLEDISAAGVVIAGSVSWITPVAYVGGAGPVLQLGFSSKGWGCVGGGLALGTVGKAFNFGPLTGGDLGSARNILSGFSVSSGLQPVPYYGMQETANSSGWLYGPTGGTPGASISGTYSFCGSVP